MISAGDHERLPNRDEEGENLLEQEGEGFIIDEKLLNKIRKGAKPSRAVQKYLGKNIKDVYNDTKNRANLDKISKPVKRKSGGNLTIPQVPKISSPIQSGDDFIKMALGNPSLNVSNSVKDKLFRKK